MDFKPRSIIITTLAAQLYKGQENVHGAIYDALNTINQNMLMSNGKFYIPNPTNTAENFAERWNEDPRFSVAFFDWLKEARNDFGAKLIEKGEDSAFAELLGESLGVTLGDCKEAGSSRISISPVYIKTDTSKARQPWGL